MNKMFLLPLLAAVAACADVNEGHMGVRVVLNESEDEAVPPGTYATNPFTTSLVEMSVRTARWTALADSYTSDLQQTKIAFSHSYRLLPDRVVETYRRVGEDWNTKLIPQRVIKAVKDEVGTRRAAELISARPQVQARIEAAIRKSGAVAGLEIAKPYVHEPQLKLKSSG
jgi:regulator of protease activity HflC (stomatin/prohibitin superfamily)